MLHTTTPITFQRPKSSELNPYGEKKATTWEALPLEYCEVFQGVASEEYNLNRDITKVYVTLYIRRRKSPYNFTTKWKFVYNGEVYGIESAIINQSSNGLPWHMITRITGFKIEG